MLNSFSAVALGVYILAATFNGNAEKLFALAKDDFGSGYLKWLVAFLIIRQLSEYEATKQFAEPLVAVATVAMAINASKNESIWAGVQDLINLFNPNGVTSK